MDEGLITLKWIIRSQVRRIAMIRFTNAVQRPNGDALREKLIISRYLWSKIWSGHLGNLVEQPLMQLVAYGA